MCRKVPDEVSIWTEVEEQSRQNDEKGAHDSKTAVAIIPEQIAKGAAPGADKKTGAIPHKEEDARHKGERCRPGRTVEVAHEDQSGETATTGGQMPDGEDVEKVARQLNLSKLQFDECAIDDAALVRQAAERLEEDVAGGTEGVQTCEMAATATPWTNQDGPRPIVSSPREGVGKSVVQERMMEQTGGLSDGAESQGEAQVESVRTRVR